MKVSTRGIYALKIILKLALSDKEILSIREISESLDISLKYAEQIIAILNKSGFVGSKRGAMGGYYLAKEPKEIIVDDVLTATEGELNVGGEKHNSSIDFVVEDVWAEIEKAVKAVTTSISIDDLVEKHKQNENFIYMI